MMRFREWQAQLLGKTYSGLLVEIFDFEDAAEFKEWAAKERLDDYNANDWAMLAIYALDQRIKALEEKAKVKDKK